MKTLTQSLEPWAWSLKDKGALLQIRLFWLHQSEREEFNKGRTVFKEERLLLPGTPSVSLAGACKAFTLTYYVAFVFVINLAHLPVAESQLPHPVHSALNTCRTVIGVASRAAEPIRGKIVIAVVEKKCRLSITFAGNLQLEPNNQGKKRRLWILWPIITNLSAWGTPLAPPLALLSHYFWCSET